MNFQWNKIEDNSYRGQSREGHTLTYISKINCLLLHGGITNQKQKEVYLYDILSNCWKSQLIEGRIPQPRKFHAAYYSQQANALIIHGGEGEKKRSLQDFSALFIGQWKWRNIVMARTPPARSMHCMAPSRSGLLIVGGYSESHKTFLSDIWIVKHLASIRISNSSQLNVQGPQCLKLEVKVQVPLARFGHRCSMVKDSLYLFGGQSETIQKEFTVFRLNLGRRSWEKINIKHNIHQLSRFSLVQLSEDQLFIFGGVSGNELNQSVYHLFLPSMQLTLIDRNQQIQTLQSAACPVPSKPFQIYSLDFKPKCPPEFCILSETPENLFKKQPPANISLQQYLISIKNEQILSQQLIKKNSHLQQLYLVMQQYIGQLNSDYNDSGQFQEKGEIQKKRHIAYTLELKDNYIKLEDLYKDTTRKIKDARGELAEINQDFDKCMETEFDEDQ